MTTCYTAMLDEVAGGTSRLSSDRLASVDLVVTSEGTIIKDRLRLFTKAAPVEAETTEAPVELEIPTRELAQIIETALGLKAAAQWNDKQYAAAAQTIVNAIYGRWS